MLRPRLIPCLLVHQGALVKTRRFRDPRYVGDPLNAVRIFNEMEVDELMVVDIDATRRSRPPDLGLVAQLAAECRMPLCYGGGVTRETEFEQLIGLGVEKVAVSAAAVADPALIARAAERVGSQSVVAVLDVARRAADLRPEIVTHNAQHRTGRDPVAWARQVQALGAGEIVVNAVDRDGEGVGYDLDLIDQLQQVTSVPLTALGGCGSIDDVISLVRRCGVIGAAAGSMFVFKGRYRAVLINYPDRDVRDQIAAAATMPTAPPPPPRRRKANEGWTLGIDASNLLQGGGRTHLVEMLAAADPEAAGFGRVVVWGRAETLALLDARPWLECRAESTLEGGLAVRARWQRTRLSAAATDLGCDLLFVPGGSYAGQFRPVVTMCQNMLPFDVHERARYGWSSTAWRLRLLRSIQSRTFRTADGVIFLSDAAASRLDPLIGPRHGRTAIVPHGIRQDFFLAPRPQRPIAEYSLERPFRLLYVSTIDVYKHQWHVVDAVARLRADTGWPITLDLVGPAYPPALRRLQRTMDREDPSHTWVRYHGAIPHRRLPVFHGAADLGVFASTCENLPNIVMEYMAAGLPVASAEGLILRHLLGPSAVYFDPESPTRIAEALAGMIADPARRETLAQSAFEAAHDYSWPRCAELTFAFLRDVVLWRRV